MTARVLARAVVLQHEGATVVLEAGVELPDWAKERVTNPKAFVQEAKPRRRRTAASEEKG